MTHVFSPPGEDPDDDAHVTTPPPNSPEFWQEQALAFATALCVVETALQQLLTSLPSAIQQAADLGLMREQHDTAGLRTAVLGGQALADVDHERLGALEARVAALEGRL